MIKTTFKIIGAAAAAANLLLELRIPAKKDDRLTNSKNGNVTLVSSTAKLNLVWSSKKPGAMMYIKYGVKISTIVTINNKINNKELRTSSANFFPFFFINQIEETIKT